MYRFIIVLFILIVSQLVAEESIILTFENEEGKTLDKVKYTILGDDLSNIEEDYLKVSLLKKIIPGKDYVSLRGNFDNWLSAGDIKINFYYEKKEIKLEGTLPFKSSWFANGFSDGQTRIRHKHRLPSNIKIEKNSYPYRLKIILVEKRYVIRGIIRDKSLDLPISGVQVSVGGKFENVIDSHGNETDSDGLFKLIIDIKSKPNTDPYISLRKKGYDVAFKTVDINKLINRDTLNVNISLNPAIESECLFKQDCMSDLVWSDDCCQCVCDNPGTNRYYKEYRICAKRNCEENEIMTFKLGANDSYLQHCIPDQRIDVNSDSSKDENCNQIQLLQDYMNSCGGVLPKEFILDENSTDCQWCDLLCTIDQDTKCDELFSNYLFLGIISEYLSLEIRKISDDKFYTMIQNYESYVFDYLYLLYQSMDYLSRIPDKFKNVKDADMARIYLERAQFYLWYAEKIYKVPDELYGYSFKYLDDYKVGDFCKAYEDIKKLSQNRKPYDILAKIIDYGLDAFEQYDYYCTSSGLQCENINVENTKLKRIREEIRY